MKSLLVLAVSLLIGCASAQTNKERRPQLDGRTLLDTRCEEVMKYARAVALLYAAGIPYEPIQTNKTYDFPASLVIQFVESYKREEANKAVDMVMFNCMSLGYENLNVSLVVTK